MLRRWLTNAFAHAQWIFVRRIYFFLILADYAAAVSTRLLRFYMLDVSINLNNMSNAGKFGANLIIWQHIYVILLKALNKNLKFKGPYFMYGF